MSKHTQGPWEVRAIKGDGNAIVIHTQDDEVIATAWNLLRRDGSGPSTSIKANANLIAAAPELLEALGKLLDALNRVFVDTRRPGFFEFVAVCEGARKVIAKAEGRS